MTAPTLVEFLRARLDEREARARADLADAVAGHMFGLVGWRDAPAHIYGRTQARAITEAQDAIADVEAKRRIADYGPTLRRAVATEPGGLREWQRFMEYLALLALPYRDHPDYDERWAV